MRIEVNLSDEVLEFYGNQAEKNKRSRKAEMEITLTSFALKTTIYDFSTIKTKEQKKEMKEFFKQAKPLSRIEQMKKLRK